MTESGVEAEFVHLSMSVIAYEDCPDFDLWCNLMREYSEEFLGNPEHDGNGDPIDYANQEPFRSLTQAYDTGRIRVFALGVAMTR